MLLHWFFQRCIELMDPRGHNSLENTILKLKNIERKSTESFEQAKIILGATEKVIISCKEVMQLDCGMTLEKELLPQIVHDDTEREFEKKMKEGATLAQENASEFKFSEEQKKEIEDLHEILIQLKKKFEAEFCLKSEVERAIEAIKKDDNLEANEILVEMERKTSLRTELLNHMMELVQDLVAFEEEPCIKLISELSNVNAVGSIGVKRMGELDCKPFYTAAGQKYSADEAEEKAAELYSLWQDHIKDLHWHPFKTEEGNSTAFPHSIVLEMVDEEDEKLCCLKKEFGSEVCNAVVTALNEMNLYNTSGRNVVLELWNFEEGRKASLAEGVNQLKELKRKEELKGM